MAAERPINSFYMQAIKLHIKGKLAKFNAVKQYYAVKFQYYIPAYPLNQFVESMFYMNGFDPTHLADRRLPDGNVQLILELTDHPQFIYDNDTLKEIQACKRAWFSGFWTQPITIPSGRESELLVVQFHRGKAAPFLSPPMHLLHNQVVDAECVVNNGILGLREQLRNTPTVDQKLRLAEAHLLSHYVQRLQTQPCVDWLIGQLEKQPENTLLNRFYQQIGYSQKHTIKLFKDQVGVSPKNFLRIMRFQKAILEIEHNPDFSWIAVAHDCGYYDQSHFIADFKLFSGFTPVDYFSRKGEYLNYIPMG